MLSSTKLAVPQQQQQQQQQKKKKKKKKKKKNARSFKRNAIEKSPFTAMSSAS